MPKVKFGFILKFLVLTLKTIFSYSLEENEWHPDFGMVFFVLWCLTISISSSNSDKFLGLFSST